MSRNKTNFTKDTLWISALGILCAVCLMLVFLITAIEAVVYWTPGYFEAEYTKYQVLDHLPPMTMEDLLVVTDEMMAYLRGNRADLHVFTNIGGHYIEFFNAREIAHMEDVRGLFIGGLMLRKIGLAVTAAYAVILAFWCKKDQERKNLLKTVVPGSLCLGTGLFFAVALFIAATVASDFSKYFIVFHHIFFDNDLWILNPATDLLINIVPEPFFMDTALRIGITFGLMVVVFLAISFYLWKRNKKILK
ncbi:MAG: TIGR01906 family membrane protein [Lachnospiraceae bacterium]|nr:TIGR01906 family membrane protein [Lachnospiraceae bacterium]